MGTGGQKPSATQARLTYPKEVWFANQGRGVCVVPVQDPLRVGNDAP